MLCYTGPRYLCPSSIRWQNFWLSSQQPERLFLHCPFSPPGVRISACMAARLHGSETEEPVLLNLTFPGSYCCIQPYVVQHSLRAPGILKLMELERISSEVAMLQPSVITLLEGRCINKVLVSLCSYKLDYWFFMRALDGLVNIISHQDEIRHRKLFAQTDKKDSMWIYTLSTLIDS